MMEILATLAKGETTENLLQQMRKIIADIKQNAKTAEAMGLPFMVPQSISARFLAFDRELTSRGVVFTDEEEAK
jgi:hypothetical protein